MAPSWLVGVLLICALVYADQIAAGPATGQLKHVCRGDKVHLTRSAIADLVQELDQNVADKSVCSQEACNSIVALNTLLSDAEGNVCSADKAEQIVDYFGKFILNSKNRAPRAIALLFTSYGLKVSRVCRHRMATNIADATALLTAEQRAEFDLWTNESSLVAKLLPEPNDYNDLVLPKQLAKFLQTKPERMFLYTSVGEKLQRFQVFCQRRLKPIYEPLVLPLLSLAEVGFNYQKVAHVAADGDAGSQQANKLTFQWYRAVFLCESVASFVVVDESMADKSDAIERNTVRIVPQGQVDNLIVQEAAALQQLATGYPDIEKLDYAAPELSSAFGATIAEPIVDATDGDLNQAIKKFKKSRRNKSKFIYRMFKQLKQKLVQGALKFTKRFEILDANQLVKFLDDYEHNLKRVGSPVSSSLEDSFGWFLFKIGVLLALLAGVICLCIFLPIHGRTVVYIIG